MKVVYVSYPASDATSVDGGVPASADNALGLREFPEGRGHELVGTSDADDGLHRELADAEVLITTPFWPVYLSKDRIENAKNLRLVLTAGIGSDHIDGDVAASTGSPWRR